MSPKNHDYGARNLRTIGTLILALSLSIFPAAFTSAVHAQTPTKASAAQSRPSQPSTNTSTSRESASKGGPNEGIKVHGHWTIEVRNPDGMLVTHREFENGLVAPGTLVQFLARRGVPGEWGISIADQVCVNHDGNPIGC